MRAVIDKRDSAEGAADAEELRINAFAYEVAVGSWGAGVFGGGGAVGSTVGGVCGRTGQGGNIRNEETASGGSGRFIIVLSSYVDFRVSPNTSPMV